MSKNIKFRPIIWGLICGLLTISVATQVRAQTANANASADGSETVLSTASQVYNALLSTAIVEGDDGLNLFDYAGVKSDGRHAVIKTFIKEQAKLSPSQMSNAEATVFWANLYNAVTLDVVLDHYPVKSIREIKSGFRAGPWKRDLVTVEGKDLSLDDIEHKILRVKYASPFIHYMVNCASIGCPNLETSLWTVDGLKTRQEAAARAFLASSRGVTINADGDLNVSSIYNWFGKDFGGKAGVLRHIKEYGPADVQAAIAAGGKVDDDEYDWSLNE